MSHSQCDILLDHLRRGETITPARAYDLCGTLACHSRMAELRARNHAIECEVRRVNGKPVGHYRLAGAPC